MFNEIKNFIIGYSAMSEMFCVLPPMSTLAWPTSPRSVIEVSSLATLTLWSKTRLQEFPERLSLMLSLTEHFQTQLNDECSCHTHHWSAVQSFETIRAAGGLVHQANSALDFEVFD